MAKESVKVSNQKLKKIIEYLGRAKTMQLATTANDKPWVCTVYFVVDKELNLYWLSWPSRRHSQEIKINPNAAIAMQIKTDLPVIGLQAEGKVEVIKDSEAVKEIMKKYLKKYGSGGDFYDRFARGINKHQMYRFKPKKYVLFDEANFPKTPQNELQI